MRRFHFRLEAVLRHRETIEDLCEQDFAAAQSVVQGIEARIARLWDEFRRVVMGRPVGAANQSFDAHSIYDRERYLETVQAAIAQQERALEAAQIVLEEKRAALVAARQAREAVSHLHDRDLLAHVALCNKLEQDALDELATLRHVRSLAKQKAEIENQHYEREAA
jgi:flagellar export protein FliJ